MKNVFCRPEAIQKAFSPEKNTGHFSSLILGFVGPSEGFAHQRNIYLLIFGIALLYFSARSNRLERLLDRIINKMLDEFTEIRPRSFSKLMTVMEEQDEEIEEEKD